MANVLELLLDGRFSELKDVIEQKIANKQFERIKNASKEVVKQINEGKNE